MFERTTLIITVSVKINRCVDCFYDSNFFFYTYVFICVLSDIAYCLYRLISLLRNLQKWRKCSKLIHFCYWCWCRCVVYGFW